MTIKKKLIKNFEKEYILAYKVTVDRAEEPTDSLSSVIVGVLTDKYLYYCSHYLLTLDLAGLARPHHITTQQQGGGSLYSLVLSMSGLGHSPDWSTLIGRGPTLLRSHWSRASLEMLAPAILCHKESAPIIQSPLLGSWFFMA